MAAKKGPIDRTILEDLYVKQGLDMAQVGLQLGRGAPNVLLYLRRYGLPIRDKYSYRFERGGNKHSQDIHFFDQWSPEMAWVLGLMFSDGNVSQKKDSQQVELCSIDRDLLESVAVLIQSTAPVGGPYKDKSAMTLSVGGEAIAKRLIELGCVPAKSRILRWPAVPAECVSHFVRGLWDGDGTVFVRDRSRIHSGRTYTYREVTTEYVSGSWEFVVSLEQVIRANTALSASVKTSQAQYKPYYRINYYHRDSLVFLRWLYQGSTPQTRLARKHALAEPFLN